jgi:hypothetical protein
MLERHHPDPARSLRLMGSRLQAISRLDAAPPNKVIELRFISAAVSHAADAFRYLAMTLDGRSVTGFHRRIEYGRQGCV